MNERDRVRLHAVVHGRVQGVGYRMYAVERAQALGLDGYVRNLPSGRSVEVVAEGERPALESLLSSLQRGPRLARVERVDTSWGAADGTLGAFDARH